MIRSLTHLKRIWLPFMAAGIVLTGILGAMVYARVQHLLTGREIVLAIRPVDPRDLFKGDYVRLAFDISRADQTLIDRHQSVRAVPVEVLIEPMDAEGKWRIAAVGPSLKPKRPDQVVLKATRTGDSLRYGIERYYVPEGTGMAIEDKARSGKLAALVAVDRNGKPAIKGLKLDGVVIHREPAL